MDTRGLLFGKGEKRSTAKARAKRQERDVISTVRAHVAARDGRCRLAGVVSMGECRGPGELAHLGNPHEAGGHKRYQTRGQAPERRHRPEGTAILCAETHHYAHDKGSGQDRLHIEHMTPAGAEGPLRFRRGSVVYEETV